MIKKINAPLILLPVLIYTFGLVTLLSTSPSLIKNHLMFFLIGFGLYILSALVDYHLFRFLWKLFYIGGAFLLVFTNLFAGINSGAARWLNLGLVSFQTSEIAKLFLIIGLASFIVEHKDRINSLKSVLLISLMSVVYAALIYIQPDLGTSAVILLITGGVVFYGGFRKLYMLVGLFLAGAFSTPIWHFLKNYQKERILVFLNPKLDVLGSGYNVIQSIIAIGSGGFMGKGFGQGTQANLQFLPAYWTDFIFASFAEEWGFVGVFLFITLYVLMLYWLLRIANQVNDLFGKLLCIGVFMMFFSQFTINVGMNLGMLPVTGVTLPLVSYGGSSMLVSLISLGMIQSIWVQRGN